MGLHVCYPPTQAEAGRREFKGGLSCLVNSPGTDWVVWGNPVSTKASKKGVMVFVCHPLILMGGRSRRIRSSSSSSTTREVKVRSLRLR